MKIIYFTDTYLPKIDGIAISISQFTERLSARGHEFMICCPSYGQDRYYPATEGVDIYRFPATDFPSYPDVKMVLPTPTAIASIVKRFQPELFHIHTPGFLGMVGIQYGRQIKKPVVATYHTLVDQQHEYLSLVKMLKLDGILGAIKSGSPLTTRLVERFTLQKWRDAVSTRAKKKFISTLVNFTYERSNLIISPSHLIKKELRGYGLSKKIRVISNGMDLEAFQGEAKKYPDVAGDAYSYPWKILHVGRLSYEKNCDILLQGFLRFREKFPKAKFTMVGDGPALKALKKLAGTLGLDTSVEFTGFFPHEKLPQIYPEHDIFWTASTMETQGLVVLEAMACGLPAIGVDAFALPELIHHGENGFLAVPFRPEQMADLLEKALTSQEDYEKFSIKSLEISQKHEIGHCTDQLEELYREMISKKT